MERAKENILNQKIEFSKKFVKVVYYGVIAKILNLKIFQKKYI